MSILNTFFEKAKDYHIVVIGDVMLDRYIHGRVDRISPEAPVPVLLWQSTESRLGGAANVALNLRRLGSRVSVVGLAGEDNAGATMRTLLETEGIGQSQLISDSTTQTTVKTRVIGGHQHLLRIDEEKNQSLSDAQADQAISALRKLITEDRPQAMILQDYNKGVLTSHFISRLMEIGREHGIPVCVDPKDEHFFAFTGATIFKPNLRELRAKMPFPVEVSDDSLARAAKHLHQELRCGMVAITLSEHGIFLSQKGESHKHPTIARNVVDVCGAGDAVISVVTLARLMGATMEEMALLANTAGGVVCGEVGVCPVNIRRMRDELADPEAP